MTGEPRSHKTLTQQENRWAVFYKQNLGVANSRTCAFPNAGHFVAFLDIFNSYESLPTLMQR
jgi:hypothetical protein